jgi:hypothetical protein
MADGHGNADSGFTEWFLIVMFSDIDDNATSAVKGVRRL